MAYKTPLWTQGREHDADLLRQLTSIVVAEGVPTAGDVRVSARQQGASMSVDVAPGRVVVADYICWSTSKVNLPITAPPPQGQSRIDSVRAVVTDDNSGTGAWEIVVVKGTSSFSPFPPSAAGVSVELARVRLNSSTTSITGADIEDRRPFASPVTISERLPDTARDGQIVVDSTGRKTTRIAGVWKPEPGISQFGQATASISAQGLGANWGTHCQSTLTRPVGPVAVSASWVGFAGATTNNLAYAELYVEISTNGGSSFTSGQTLAARSSNTLDPAPITAQHSRSGPVSGNVVARVRTRRTGNLAAIGLTGSLQIMMIPA